MNPPPGGAARGPGAGFEARLNDGEISAHRRGPSRSGGRVHRRQQVERPRIIQAIAEARGHGDLSENAEYHSAKEAQSHNEGRIVELEDMLQRAEVIDVSKLSGSTVKFGATVTLIDEDTEQKRSSRSSANPRPT